MMDPNTNTTRSSRFGQALLLLVGSVGPLGHLPASGTITVALVGIPLYFLTCEWSRTMFALAVVLFALASVWLHEVGDRWLGEKDSRKLVWDEIVGYLIAIAWLGGFSWTMALTAFFIERLIDIVKVPPARWIERRWPGGWGVVGDDVVAGLYTAAVLALLGRLWPAWFGG